MFAVVHDDEQMVISRGPDVFLQTALLKLGDRTEDGVLVMAPSAAWFKMAAELGMLVVIVMACHPVQGLAGARKTTTWPLRGINTLRSF